MAATLLRVTLSKQGVRCPLFSPLLFEVYLNNIFAYLLDMAFLAESQTKNFQIGFYYPLINQQGSNIVSGSNHSPIAEHNF